MNAVSITVRITLYVVDNMKDNKNNSKVIDIKVLGFITKCLAILLLVSMITFFFSMVVLQHLELALFSGVVCVSCFMIITMMDYKWNVLEVRNNNN